VDQPGTPLDGGLLPAPPGRAVPLSSGPLWRGCISAIQPDNLDLLLSLDLDLEKGFHGVELQNTSKPRSPPMTDPDFRTHCVYSTVARRLARGCPGRRAPAAIWAMVIVSAVGWTSASAVHRIPRRRWWTALRLSTLRDRVAGTTIKATICALAPVRDPGGGA